MCLFDFTFLYLYVDSKRHYLIVPPWVELEERST